MGYPGLFQHTYIMTHYFIVSLTVKHIVFPIRLSVFLSGCPSDWLSVTRCVRSYERNSSHSFSQIFVKHCRCFFNVCRFVWRLAVILRIVLSLVCSLNVVFFICVPSTNAYRHWVSSSSSYSFSQNSMKLKKCCCEDVKMYMRFGCNAQLNFVTFFAVWTLSSLKTESSKWAFGISQCPSSELS